MPSFLSWATVLPPPHRHRKSELSRLHGASACGLQDIGSLDIDLARVAVGPYRAINGHLVAASALRLDDATYMRMLFCRDLNGGASAWISTLLWYLPDSGWAIVWRSSSF